MPSRAGTHAVDIACVTQAQNRWIRHPPSRFSSSPLLRPFRSVMSTRPATDAGDDSGEWEQQTTRKQRKAAAKNAPATATAAPAAASDASFPLSDAPQAASSSSFPIADDADAEAAMENDFMDAGHIGLDGQVMPRALSQPAAAAAPAAAAPTPAASAASSSSSSASSGVSTSQGGASGRRPRYVFDETQLPKCFVCQTRHDIGECRKKEKL